MANVTESPDKNSDLFDRINRLLDAVEALLAVQPKNLNVPPPNAANELAVFDTMSQSKFG